MTDASWMKRIREIPENGEWWSSDSNVAFNWIYLELTKKGFTQDEAIELLEKAYSAVADEFGG